MALPNSMNEKIRDNWEVGLPDWMNIRRINIIYIVMTF